MGDKFEEMYDNVNYGLRNATKEFAKLQTNN